MNVTHQPTCYVYVCLGCDMLDSSNRSDRLTCSNACRVKAHRSGALKELRQRAQVLQIPAAMLAHADAVWLLRPDLAKKVVAGTVTLDAIRNDIRIAFDRAVMKAACVARDAEVRNG